MAPCRCTYELAVLSDLKQRGARILGIATGISDLAGIVDDALDLQTSVPERARALLYLPVLQLMAYYRAIGRGLNPDRPRNLVMSVRLSGAEMVDDAG